MAHLPSHIANEKITVQDPLIRYAEDIGWTFLSPEQALTFRKGESGVLLYPVLQQKLIELNPGIVDMNNVGEVISKIESVRSNMEGNAEMLAWMRGEKSIHVEKEKRSRAVTVIDFEHPQNNVFHVTEEWRFNNGLNGWDRKANRPDVLFLINGIPVVIVETKSAALQDGMEKAVKQLRRYHDETPEMMTPPQIFAVTHVLDYHYGVTWNLERKSIFNWKDEEPGNFEKKVKVFFGRERLLRAIKDWILFFKRNDELKKAILRQHQTRAVDKVVDRALDPVKRRGLVWHTQGSGKTFTMLTAARKLLENPAFDKPTILLLIDRNELEGQLKGWAESLFGEGKAVIAESKEHLRELLRADYRGLIISMIHKFDRADTDMNTRGSIYIFVDEAHRTTTGDLGTYLEAALPNATMIGFTGTPIDRIAFGTGTFKVFGKDDPSGYLDKYSIAESIQDETTLELHYTLAPNEVMVPKEILESEFLDLAEAEGISDIEELNRILDKAVRMKTLLKAADRVEKVAAYVAKDFVDRVEPLGYKAFLVGVDREACALYKAALDKLLPPEYSRVVYTVPHNDPELTAQHRLPEDEEKRLRKSFLKPDNHPKILIVTEKLLTGFDAPVLYCMYLDKPMRDHTLLQAIARVNRPYESNGRKKPSGFVVDFVGIFENLEKALSFDSDVVQSVIRNIDVLKKRFETLIKDDAQEFLSLCRGTIDDKAVERVVVFFADKDRREAFTKLFLQIESLYEILSPDAFLRPYIEDFKGLLQIHRIVKENFSPKTMMYGDIGKKTEHLVRENAAAFGFQAALPLTKIDAEALAALKKDENPGKVINLIRCFAQVTGHDAHAEPFLFPISERADALRERYEDRQVSTQEALKELEQLINDRQTAEKEWKEQGLDAQTFGLYWILKQDGIEPAAHVARDLQAQITRFPDFQDNANQRRQLKAALYKVLLPIVGKGRMVDIAERLMKLSEKSK